MKCTLRTSSQAYNLLGKQNKSLAEARLRGEQEGMYACRLLVVIHPFYHTNLFAFVDFIIYHPFFMSCLWVTTEFIHAFTYVRIW